MRRKSADSIRARRASPLHHEAGYKCAVMTLHPTRGFHLPHGTGPYKRFRLSMRHPPLLGLAWRDRSPDTVADAFETPVAAIDEWQWLRGTWNARWCGAQLAAAQRNSANCLTIITPLRPLAPSEINRLGLPCQEICIEKRRSVARRRECGIRSLGGQNPRGGDREI